MQNLMKEVEEQIMFLSIKSKLTSYAVAKSLDSFDQNTKYVRGDYDSFLADTAADIDGFEEPVPAQLPIDTPDQKKCKSSD